MTNVNKYDCIVSNTCIYDLDQAVRHYYKKAVEVLKKKGFVKRNVDPCIYEKKSAKGVIYTTLYIDDNLMIRNMEASDEAIMALKTVSAKGYGWAARLCPAKGSSIWIKEGLVMITPSH